MRVPNFLY